VLAFGNGDEDLQLVKCHAAASCAMRAFCLMTSGLHELRPLRRQPSVGLFDQN
jgi:hypothetical protein